MTKYKFTVMDALREYLFRKSKKPEISYKKVGNDLYRVNIGNTEVYWIDEKNMYEIKHLYAETFFEHWRNNHVFEYKECKIEAGMNVLDAGCCEGFFSIFALRKKARKVVAVEPLPQLCLALKNTFCAEISGDKVILINALLGREQGEGFIDVNSEMICASSENKTRNGQGVKKTTIDELVKGNVVDRFDFIKMDIEGGEMEAVIGAKETLLTQKPKLAIAVYHGYENAMLVKKQILSIRNDYKVSFRGKYCYEKPPRPYMLYAF